LLSDREKLILHFVSMMTIARLSDMKHQQSPHEQNDRGCQT